MKMAFVFAPGRRARYSGVHTGICPREFFYGATEIGERGHEVAWYEVDGNAESTGGWRVVDLLYRWHLTPTRTTAPLLRQLHARLAEINASDVVIATTSGIAYGLAALKTIGLLRPPLIGIHCGIVNYRPRFRRRMLNALMLRRMWTQLFGQGELEPARRLFHIPADRIEVNQFGVDTTFWTPDGVAEEGYVLSVGNDARRDYDLLIKVARRMESTRFVLVTKRAVSAHIPPNVRILYGDWHAEALSDVELRSLYRGARFVVIPLKESYQPSGQSVCLQAMACGKLVVLTETRGLWSRETMRNGENVVLVPPGDADALLGVMRELEKKPEACARIGENARRTVCSEGEITQFALRLEALCRRVTMRSGKVESLRC